MVCENVAAGFTLAIRMQTLHVLEVIASILSYMLHGFMEAIAI